MGIIMIMCKLLACTPKVHSPPCNLTIRTNQVLHVLKLKHNKCRVNLNPITFASGGIKSFIMEKLLNCQQSVTYSKGMVHSIFGVLRKISYNDSHCQIMRRRVDFLGAYVSNLLVIIMI